MNNSFAKVLIVICFFLTVRSSFGQLGLDYYLPELSYNEKIPTPQSVLNFEIGEWHITHGQLYLYMTRLCEASENCQLFEYARSHENKPLFYLLISSKENMENIESLKKQHWALTQPGSDSINLENIPLVLYQGYSIHGNESSGANAACLVGYYLLAGQSQKLERLLENTIILLDPCYNPDGFQRFSTWANSNRHHRLNTDPTDREFNEQWPGGRTNHYWFDLNRDWLFNIHPSSKGRIETFHEWKPDILTDHHEMGSNSTFFFQPGVPSRTNPNTPKINQEITEEIGTYHAAYLDSIGSMYFTKERYDDYYYGKGSTYPDINGCIGILFEQASSRGHLRETRNGLLSFPFTIRNQVVTSLSTQQAAMDMKSDVLSYKRDFYREAMTSEAAKGFYVFEEEDPYKSRFFTDLLKRHDIKVYRSSQNMKLKGKTFDKEHSFVVPKNQYQARLIKTIFEKVTSFPDSIFYDVSAWTLPLAFNMNYEESMALLDSNTLTEFRSSEEGQAGQVSLEDSTVALALDWSNYMAPAALNSVLEADIPVRILKRNNSYKVNGKKYNFPAGTVIIPLTEDTATNQSRFKRVSEIAKHYEVNIDQISTGLALEGQSIGSNELEVLEEKNIAIIVGEGVNAYEAGDCWYQLDKRWNMKISLINKTELDNARLSRYDIIILPDGQYSNLDAYKHKLENWLSQGGTLIAFRRSVSWLIGNNWMKAVKETEIEESFEEKESREGSYITSGANAIGGCILNTNINQEHPLLFGYEQSQLPVFKKGTQFYTVEKTAAVPLSYTEEPRLSGYISKRNLKLAPGSASVICSSYGEGKIIASIDNPNFRAYWLGGSKLFANMLYMSDFISEDSMLDSN